MTHYLERAGFALVLLFAFVGANSVAMGLSNRATASRQPALVYDQAASRLAPTGFDQAQGER